MCASKGLFNDWDWNKQGERKFLSSSANMSCMLFARTWRAIIAEAVDTVLNRLSMNILAINLWTRRWIQSPTKGPNSTSSWGVILLNRFSLQPWNSVPRSQVKPLLVTWWRASWNTPEVLAANQSIAVLSAWAQLPLTRRRIKIKQYVSCLAFARHRDKDSAC